MKYKVKILKQPKYQDGGYMEQEDNGQSQVLQIIQAFAQANGVDPKELIAKIQSMDPTEQQQIISQMYKSLQSGGAEQQQAYAQNMQEDESDYEQSDDEEDEMPVAAYGGQMGYGLDLGSRRLWMNQDDDEQSMVNRSIKEVPREEANIEAEGGETALIPNKDDNNYSHFNIQGKRHTNGGVPLNVPEGTFIYSDTKKMKLGGSILNVFGKSEKSSKKYTPAALAKQYNLNKYTAILESPKSSQIEKRTAELMIQNYNKKLAQLALVQEGKKGYPQGIPAVAKEYYAKTKAYIEEKQARSPQKQNQEQQSNQDVDQDMEQGEQPQAMYGMGFRYGGGLQKFQGDKESSQFNGVPYSYDDPVVKENNSSDDVVLDNTVNNDVSDDSLDDSAPEEVTTNYGFGIGKGGKKGMFANPKLSLPESNVPNNVYKPFNYNLALNEFQQAKDFINNMQVGFPSSTNSSNHDGSPSGINAMRRSHMKNHPELYKLNYTYNKDGEEDKDEDEFKIDKSKIKYGWTNPDKLNLLNSFINMASVRKSTPFEASVKFERPETRYVDPARALAANTEQYNAARQAAAMFAGPQSRYSFNAGQFGKNAADIIGQYGNQNVQMGNIAATQATDINNKQILYDAQRAKRLYDAGVIGEQQYQNAMRQARAGVLQAYTQGMKNASDLYNLNMSESPYYAYEPGRGTMYFHSPKAFNLYNNERSSSKKLLSPEEFAKSFDQSLYGKPTPADYYKYYAKALGQGSSSKSEKDYND